MLKQIQSLCIGNVDMSYIEVRHGGIDHISYFKHINKRHSFQHIWCRNLPAVPAAKDTPAGPSAGDTPGAVGWNSPVQLHLLCSLPHVTSWRGLWVNLNDLKLKLGDRMRLLVFPRNATN